MPTTIIVPQLGESVVEGTIGKWLKKVGEPIAKDEPVVEIITDKINIELPAPVAGSLGQILLPEGTVAQVGQELGVILAPGEALAAGAGAAAAPPPAAPAPSRAPAPAPPMPAAAPAYSPAATAAAPPATAPAVRTDASDHGVVISPAVRKLLREHSLDVAQIRGSGAGGRVTRDDVLRHVEALKTAGPAVAAAPRASVPAPAAAPEYAAAAAPAAAFKAIPTGPAGGASPHEEVIEALTIVRKKIAENMLRARHLAAHCAVQDEADMTALVELRARLKERVKAEYGINLTYMPFIMKACVKALKEHPVCNATMTETEVRYRKYYNIGVAVHRDAGLIVPNVKDADRKTLLELARDIEDLGNRARAEKLTLDDIQGGTFTITNAGMFGATSSTPVLNHPEVCVLGVHLIQERPVVRDHRIVIRQMMTLSLSFDHRLVDGTPAVKFLHRVKELLEDPESWLLEAV
jgi:2-oxoglutarate dehydrogenase E2 component (dihydrolipoamide succinyltransferase)